VWRPRLLLYDRLTCRGRGRCRCTTKGGFWHARAVAGARVLDVTQPHRDPLGVGRRRSRLRSSQGHPETSSRTGLDCSRLRATGRRFEYRRRVRASRVSTGSARDLTTATVVSAMARSWRTPSATSARATPACGRRPDASRWASGNSASSSTKPSAWTAVDQERVAAVVYDAGVATRRQVPDPVCCLCSDVTNTRNTPIEALERAYPLQVLRQRLRHGTGGAGAASGGGGIEHDLQSSRRAAADTRCPGPS
jgi:hypothetical protein